MVSEVRIRPPPVAANLSRTIVSGQLRNQDQDNENTVRTALHANRLTARKGGGAFFRRPTDRWRKSTSR